MSERLAFIINRIGTLELFLVGSAVFLGFLVWQDFYNTAFIFFATFVLVMGTVGVLKLALPVARPEGARVSSITHAFPSGHAAASSFLAVYGSFLFFEHLPLPIATILTIIVIGMAGLISLSRIALRMHTINEVIAGIAIGVIIPLVILTNQPFIVEMIYRFLPL